MNCEIQTDFTSDLISCFPSRDPLEVCDPSQKCDDKQILEQSTDQCQYVRSVLVRSGLVLNIYF